MNSKYKLYFQYLLLNINHFYFKYIYKNNKNINIFVKKNTLYYLSLHFKLSTLFYSTQLIDLFGYESSFNNNTNNNKNKIKFNKTKIIVYNFHNIFFNQRFTLFILNYQLSNNIEINNHNFKNMNININSITELFLNANWLEREISELHGIFFLNKKDLRNLMLQYGDNSAPMIKSTPSIGFRELYYDSISDLIIQTPVTIQF